MQNQNNETYYVRGERNYTYTAEHLQYSWKLFTDLQEYILKLCDSEEHFSEVCVRFPRFVQNYFTKNPKAPKQPLNLEEFKGFLFQCIRLSKLKRYQSFQKVKDRQSHIADNDPPEILQATRNDFAELEQLYYIMNKIAKELTELERCIVLKVLVQDYAPSEFVEFAAREFNLEINSAKVMRVYHNGITKIRHAVVRYLQRVPSRNALDEKAYEWARKARLVD